MRAGLLNVLRPYRVPPAGGFLSPRAVLEMARTLAAQSLRPRGLPTFPEAAEQELGAALTQLLRQPVAGLYGSGKESLYRLFCAIKEGDPRRLAAISAYTCPDVAAAAVRAGLKVLPLDVDRRTLEPLAPPEEHLRDLAVVVLTNPYGMPDRDGTWDALCKPAGIKIIDDACQSALSKRNTSAVADWTVVSFGRGKALAALGGGAVLLGDPSKHVSPLPKSEVRRAEGVLQSASTLAAAALLAPFEHPRLYWMPAALPFLHLGETRFEAHFEVRAMTSAKLIYAQGALKRITERRELLLAAARHWHSALQGVKVIEPLFERGFDLDGAIVPIRYPILFPDAAQREAAASELEHLGASRSYPKTLQRWTELSEALVDVPTPGALEVSERILTLPLNRSVSSELVRRTVDVIRRLTE